jgi:uncharacterized protein
MDQEQANPTRPLDRAGGWLAQQAIRGISGMEPSRSLVPMMPRIGPRPVLLVAGGRAKNEVETSRLYRDVGGDRVELWVLPDAGHTAGRRTHPVRYEQRTVGFLDRALGAR